jgi:hypothetical protein
MSETLRYVSGLLANFPDNSQGLIDAVHMRDFVASFINGRGFIVDETDVTIPITDGVWTAVNPLLVSPEFFPEALWTFDGNNFAIQNYSGIPDIIIPVGYSKLLSLVAWFTVTKAAGGSDNYIAQFTKNGVGIGLPEVVSFAAAGSQTVTIIDSEIVDLSVVDTYGVQIQGDGTNDDLVMNYFTMQPADSILLSEPTP